MPAGRPSRKSPFSLSGERLVEHLRKAEAALAGDAPLPDDVRQFLGAVALHFRMVVAYRIDVLAEVVGDIEKSQTIPDVTKSYLRWIAGTFELLDAGERQSVRASFDHALIGKPPEAPKMPQGRGMRTGPGGVAVASPDLSDVRGQL